MSHDSPSSPEGYRIPDVFKNVSLTIASWIARPAVDIFDAWRSQFYCNYLIEDCLSQPSFFSSVYGTSFDTGCAVVMSCARHHLSDSARRANRQERFYVWWSRIYSERLQKYNVWWFVDRQLQKLWWRYACCWIRFFLAVLSRILMFSCRGCHIRPKFQSHLQKLLL